MLRSTVSDYYQLFEHDNGIDSARLSTDSRESLSKRRKFRLDALAEPDKNIKTRLKEVLNRYNCLIFGFFIFLMILGGGIGAAAFFGVRQLEHEAENKDFKTYSDIHLEDMKQRIYHAIRAVESTRGLYTINNGTVNYYTTALPFIKQTQLLLYPGITALGFVRYLQQKNRTSYVINMRKQGPDFVNFTINNISEENRLVEAPIADEYFVIEHVYPQLSERLSLGLNCLSSPAEEPIITLMRKNGQDGVTSIFKLVDGTTSTIYYSPVRTMNSNFVGFVSGIIDIHQVFSPDETSNTTNFIGPNILTFIFDTSITIEESQKSLFYASNNADYLNTIKIIENAPYKSNRSLIFGQHVWKIWFVPNNEFILDHDKWEKYIGLASSLILAIIVWLAFIIVVKLFQYNTNIHKLNRDKVSTLRECLEQISDQEQNMRSMLDAVPDHILVIDSDGRILEFNASFDKAFNMTLRKLREGMYLSSLLIDLSPNFFHDCIIEQMETSMKRTTGGKMPVAVTIRPLFGTRRDQGDHELKGAKNYLVVIRNLTDRDTLMNQLTKQQEDAKNQHLNDIVWLDSMMEDSEFRNALHSYCEKELNAENVLFLEAVRAYKRQSIEERISKQKNYL